MVIVLNSSSRMSSLKVWLKTKIIQINAGGRGTEHYTLACEIVQIYSSKRDFKIPYEVQEMKARGLI